MVLVRLRTRRNAALGLTDAKDREPRATATIVDTADTVLRQTSKTARLRAKKRAQLRVSCRVTPGLAKIESKARLFLIDHVLQDEARKLGHK
jgi:hypothetical protein